jgi:hypothetical protein
MSGVNNAFKQLDSV